jgi:hypothetical protein
MRRYVIRASEIGEYVYCARAWWLRQIEGHASTNQRALRSGTRTHRRHGRQVGAAIQLRRIAVLLLLLALSAALMAIWLEAGG